MPLFQVLCWALPMLKGTCQCCPGTAQISTTMSKHVNLEGHLHVFWRKCTKIVLWYSNSYFEEVKSEEGTTCTVYGKGRWLGVVMRHSSDPGGLNHSGYFKSCLGRSSVGVCLSVLLCFLKKKKSPQLHMDLEAAKENSWCSCRDHHDVGMCRACITSCACLGLWHVVGVYSCDKKSDEMAPYKQSRISSPKYP